MPASDAGRFEIVERVTASWPGAAHADRAAAVDLDPAAVLRRRVAVDQGPISPPPHAASALPNSTAKEARRSAGGNEAAVQVMHMR
jgi:hypothetical protein